MTDISSLTKEFPSLSRKIYVSNGKLPQILIANGVPLVPLISRFFSSDQSLFTTENCFRLKFTNTKYQNGKNVNVKLDLITDVEKKQHRYQTFTKEYISYTSSVCCKVRFGNMMIDYRYSHANLEEEVLNETVNLAFWLKRLTELMK